MGRARLLIVVLACPFLLPGATAAGATVISGMIVASAEPIVLEGLGYHDGSSFEPVLQLSASGRAAMGWRPHHVALRIYTNIPELPPGETAATLQLQDLYRRVNITGTFGMPGALHVVDMTMPTFVFVHSDDLSAVNRSTFDPVELDSLHGEPYYVASAPAANLTLIWCRPEDCGFAEGIVYEVYRESLQRELPLWHAEAIAAADLSWVEEEVVGPRPSSRSVAEAFAVLGRARAALAQARIENEPRGELLQMTLPLPGAVRHAFEGRRETLSADFGERFTFQEARISAAENLLQRASESRDQRIATWGLVIAVLALGAGEVITTFLGRRRASENEARPTRRRFHATEARASRRPRRRRQP